MQQVPQVPCTKVNCTLINKVPFCLFVLIITSYTRYQARRASAWLCSRREEQAERRSRRGQSSTSAGQGCDSGPTAVLGLPLAASAAAQPRVLPPGVLSPWGAPSQAAPAAQGSPRVPHPAPGAFIPVFVMLFLQSLSGPQHTETFSKCFKKCH